MLATAAPLGHPAGSSAIVAAVTWLQATLLGTVATVVATIAVAACGLMMLSGRINYRRGITVILGCFILFGASSIAEGIRLAAAGERVSAPVVEAKPDPLLSIPRPPPNRDPYAGAAVLQ